MYAPTDPEVTAAPPQRAAIPGINAPTGAGLPPTQYDELFAQSDRDNGLPAGMTKMVAWKESRFNPNAVSPVGAQGLMQFMPQTAKRFNIDPLDPKQAIPATGAYLRKNYEMFGDWSHALAGYNWGEGNVQKMLTNGDRTPPAETKDYVKTIIGKLNMVPQDAQVVDNGLSNAPSRGADIGIGPNNDLYVNGQTFSSNDYGKAIELYRAGAFTSPGTGTLPPGFKPPKPGDIETYFQNIVPGSDTMKAIKGGIANYKAGWNEIIGAGYQIAGTPAASNPGIQAADINKRYAEQMGATSGLPQTWDSAQGAGGVAQLAYGKFLESIPFMVEALSTGLAGAGVRAAATRGAVAAAQLAAKSAGEAALMTGATAEAAQAAAQGAAKEVFKSVVPAAMREAPNVAMFLGTLPSSAGDILGNQREQAGKYAPGAAAALAIPYAALNLLGAGPQAVKAITGEALHGAVAGMGGATGRLVRGATTAAWTGIEQGAQEAGQEVMNQAGRVAVDPNASMTSPDAIARYKESALVGGLIGIPGGALAGVSARVRTTKPFDLVKGAEPVASPQSQAAATNDGQQPPMAPVSANIAPTPDENAWEGEGGAVLPDRAVNFAPQPQIAQAGAAAPPVQGVAVAPPVAPAPLAEPAVAELPRAAKPAGTVEIVSGRRPLKGLTSVDTTFQARAEERAAKKKAAAQVPEAARPGSDETVQPPRGDRAGEPPVESSSTAPAPAPTEAAPTDAEIGDEEAKKISSLFAVSRKTRERPKEPSGREQRKASVDTVGTKRLHEELQNNGELNAHVERIEKLNRSLRGPDDYLSKSKADLAKPVSERGRASARSGIDRVAADSKERATRIEHVLDTFDQIVKKHGVAKLNAVFEFRKKYDLERNPRTGEQVNEDGEVDTSDNRKQAEVNIRLSNLWRLHRQGKFDTNAFGFTRGGAHAMGRSRIEAGAKPTTLISWFNGEHKMLHRGGGTIKGVKALAYYMRMYGRSDLEGLLGGRLYHIFGNTGANTELHVLEGDHFTMADGRLLDGAFITGSAAKPISVNTENGVLTIKKPTILITNKTATEEVVPHELLHAATWHVISIDAAARAKFVPIIKAIKSAKPEKLSPNLKTMIAAVTDENEAVAVAELVSYGFTNPEFQNFLKTIEMAPPRSGRVEAAINNAFQFFVNLVKLVTGAHGAKYTALARFIEEGARLLDKAEATGGKGKTVALGANSFFKAAAFRNLDGKTVVESGVLHDRKVLPAGDALGKWEAGFVDHQGKFYTRDQASRKVDATRSEGLHSADVDAVGGLGHVAPRREFNADLKGWMDATKEAGYTQEKNAEWDATHIAHDGEGKVVGEYDVAGDKGWMASGDEPTALGHTATTPVEERVAFGNLLNPVVAVERAYQTLVKYTLPFLHAEVGEKSTFEQFVEKNAAKLTARIIDNHPMIARVATGVIDKFGVPEKWQAIVDMGRKKVHNADQISFGWWENMRGFSDEQQKLVHDYIASDGKLDVSKLDEPQQTFLANLNLTLKNIVERAAEQGTLPKGLKGANPVELVRWINKDTARLAFGLKVSGNYSNWPKGYTANAYNTMVLGQAEGYHRGVADMPNPDPAAPYYVYVPEGANLAAKAKELGYAIKDLDTSRVWRVLKEKDKTKTMWSGIPYNEGRQMMKATNFTDALVVTMHNLMHDTAANEWANSAVAGSAVDSKDSLVYADRGALANDVGDEHILDDVNHPKRELLARTPGYWVLLGNGYGELSGKYVPATVYSIITDVRDKSPFFPEYRTLLNFWKKTKTAWSPATHFNNVASSFVMAYVNDIPGSTIAKAFHTFVNREGEGKEVWDAFTYSGALVSSFSAGEVGTSIARKIDAVISKEHHAESAVGLMRLLHVIEQTKAVQLAGKVADTAIEWYQHEDNVFRLAAFMEGQRRGMNTESAGKFAADSMINYSIDARYINNLRKTVMPFLAWPYRMVPMMIRTALFKPWKLATMITGLYALNALSYAITGDDEDEERKKLPEYLRGSMFLMPGAPQALRLPFTSDGKPVYWNISSFMPLGNFAEESRNGLFGIQGWPQGLMPSGPLITAAELFLNHDSFTDKPIYQSTESGAEKFGDTLKAAWTAFAPNIPLPYNRQGDKIADLLKGKHGITGDEMGWGLTLLSMVGPKLVALDERERGAQAGIATAAIVHEYRVAIHKMAREEMRYENPDYDKIHEQQASLIARMLTRIKKAKGEE